MKYLLTFCLSLLGNVAFAQGMLEIKDISQPNDVFSGMDNEAAVIFRCHHSIPLSFSSTMDKTVEPFKSELQGTDSVYYVTFPTGKNYRGRVVSIIASGYSPLFLNMELEPKQLLSFQVTDPNATVDAGCYREHRNKGVAELKKANYEEARNQFMLASDCSDVNKDENEKNISQVNTLISYRAKAEVAFEMLDYVLADKYYTQIIALNPYDTYAEERHVLCVKSFTQECGAIFSKAEFYYSEKEYAKAKDLYQQVVSKECTNNIEVATERLNTISGIMRDKSTHARIITYEFRKDVPIGLSYGKYNEHKVGYYFAMDFNSKVFDAIRNDCKYGDKDFPELNMSVGWTVKVYDPIWIHFGPGFTGKMYYGKYAKDQYPVVGYGEDNLLDTKDRDEDDMKKANAAIAISPEIGVTAKYSYFALRLTYQYRWSIQSKLQDFMGRSRLSIGVGVAF